MMGLGGGPAHTYRGINLSTSVPSGVVDQVGPTRTGSVAGITSDGPGGSGQTVTFGSNPSAVTGARFSLNGVGTRFGSVRLAVYAEDGADLPTGAPLAFSPLYGMEDMATGDTDTYFPLSDWTPSASTKYGFVLEPFDYFRQTSHGMLIGSAAGGYADGVNVDNATESPSPIDAQNAGWSATAGTDLDFTVYSVSGSDTASSPDDIEKLAPSQIMMAAITRRPRYPR